MMIYLRLCYRLGGLDFEKYRYIMMFDFVFEYLYLLSGTIEGVSV